MKETKLTCPVCGAHFHLPEHEHLSAGIAIGKDSGLGEIHPALEEDGNPGPDGTPRHGNRAEARLAALKAAGIDTSGLFSLKGAAGEGLLVRIQDGMPVLVKDDDPIFNDILKGMTIPERRLFRRWIPSQLFRLMGDEQGSAYARNITRLGFRYTWNMLLDELHAQARLARHDYENWMERNRWFNARTARQMADDYIVDLENYIDALPVRKYKKQPYKKVGSVNMFIEDIEAMTAKLRAAAEAISASVTPDATEKSVRAFMDLMPKSVKTEADYFSPDGRTKRSKAFRQSPAWKNAYKGSGAYYSIKNLILFHGNNYPGAKDRNESLLMLRRDADAAAKDRGYRMLGIYKDMLHKEGVRIDDLRREWRQAKLMRSATQN